MAAGNVPSCSAAGLNPGGGGRECPVLQRRGSESGWWRQGMSRPAAPLVRILGLFQSVGGRECPVLQRRVSESGWWRQGMSLPAAPLVRILLSLAVNVGLFSAVCTYLACFSPSAGLFQPLSAQSSVRCRRFSRFSVKFRCSPQSLVRFRYSPQLGFRHT